MQFDQGPYDDFRLGVSAAGIPFTGAGLGIGVFAEGSVTTFSEKTTISDILQGTGNIIKQIAETLNVTAAQAKTILSNLHEEASRLHESQEEKDDDDEKEN